MMPKEIAELSVENISKRGFKVIENKLESLYIVFNADIDEQNLAKSLIELMHLCKGVKNYGVQMTAQGLEVWIHPVSPLV